jgi:hypothetical protein
MSVKIKAGTNFQLPVVFEGISLSDVASIEFIFTQTMTGDTIKSAIWVNEGASRDAIQQDGRTILVNFSRDDSYLFKENATFYMDTRIHYSGSDTNPYTKIIGLQMNETLFKAGEEVTA